MKCVYLVLHVIDNFSFIFILFVQFHDYLNLLLVKFNLRLLFLLESLWFQRLRTWGDINNF